MVSLCVKAVVSVCRRNVICSTVRYAHKTMGDPLEHATGIEKRELLAKAAGNENPFDFKVLKRGVGTKDHPNEVPSAFDARMIGCICELDATTINWMWLHQGHPRRCECGHWFKLVQKAPV